MNNGDKIPSVTLKTDKGDDYRLDTAAGGPVVIYFYPKANTPGCNQEACDFNDRIDSFRDKEVVVIGISPDQPAALAKFRQKFGLDFILLSDPENIAAKAFGVWQEKSMYGKKYMGIVRSTFVFDARGILTASFDGVKVKGHAEDVLEQFA